MSGIVFFGSSKYKEVRSFYINQVGCGVWVDQGSCVILRHGNQLFGFCEREEADLCGVITFFYDTRDEVDKMYDKFKDVALAPPRENDQYDIYNFFASDPEGRKIEFQMFRNHVDNYLSGDELLLTRRSFRKFKNIEITQDKLNRLMELCRYAPTSRNTQSYYIKFITDKDLMEKLSRVRDKSSASIKNGAMAVAICTDPKISMRHVQDGCIAAYHFILSAWTLGLGTCWIAAMDREDVKTMLQIPHDHYVATVTPLGYPQNKTKDAPERKSVEWFLRES